MDTGREANATRATMGKMPKMIQVDKMARMAIVAKMANQDAAFVARMRHLNQLETAFNCNSRKGKCRTNATFNSR
jgi:hypothetical protein